MKKKWMLHYFHEKTYTTQPLEKFEAEAAKAAALGLNYNKTLLCGCEKTFKECN